MYRWWWWRCVLHFFMQVYTCISLTQQLFMHIWIRGFIYCTASDDRSSKEMRKDKLHTLKTLVFFIAGEIGAWSAFFLCRQHTPHVIHLRHHHIAADDRQLAGVQAVGLMMLKHLPEERDEIDEDIIVECRQLLQETAGPRPEVLGIDLHGRKEPSWDDMSWKSCKEANQCLSQ